MANIIREPETIRVMKRCPNCNWRVFDKISITTGVIELKCPNCHKVVKFDLAFRKTAYRRCGC